MPEIPLEDRPVRLPSELAREIDTLGSLCGLTGDQMLGAMTIMFMRREGLIQIAPPAPAPAPAEPKEQPAPGL